MFPDSRSLSHLKAIFYVYTLILADLIITLIDGLSRFVASPSFFVLWSFSGAKLQMYGAKLLTKIRPANP